MNFNIMPHPLHRSISTCALPRISSSLAVVALAILSVCATINTGYAHGAAEIDASFPHGHVSALVHAQGLSHFALHSSGLQRVLAAPYSPSVVVIVGVEWGDEVDIFASQGYKVIAFEPIPSFVKHVREKLDHHPDWDVTLHPFAVGNPSDTTTTVNITYANHGKTFTHVAPLKRLDDVLHGQTMAVLSVDIQGDEAAVLKGAEKLLAAGNVSTLWVEAIGCNNARVRDVLDMLDRHDYVIMDFVPWGKSQQDANENVGSVPKTAKSFVYDKKRPGAFDDYVKWLCAKKEKSFEWLQTDLLAIHRDTFEDVLSMMLNLGEHVCELHDANCVLRDILHKLPEYGRQATLIEEEDFMKSDTPPDQKDNDFTESKDWEKDEDIRKEEIEGEHAIDEEEDMRMDQYDYDLDDVDMHAGHVEHGAADDTVDMNKEEL